MGFEPTTFSLARRRSTTEPRPRFRLAFSRECRDTESNCGHRDFQSRALPTELSRRYSVVKRAEFYLVTWGLSSKARRNFPDWCFYLCLSFSLEGLDLLRQAISRKSCCGFFSACDTIEHTFKIDAFHPVWSESASYPQQPWNSNYKPPSSPWAISPKPSAASWKA